MALHNKVTTLFPVLLLVVCSASVVCAQSSTYFFAGSNSLAVKDSQGDIKYLYQDRLGTDTRTKSLPFGQIIDLGDRFGFTGNEQDSSGLHHFVARTYDSSIGRFTRIDPVPSEPAYQYAHNRPLVFVDPLGTEVFSPSSMVGGLMEVRDTINYLMGVDIFSIHIIEDGAVLNYDSGLVGQGFNDDTTRELFLMWKTLIDDDKRISLLNYGQDKLISESSATRDSIVLGTAHGNHEALYAWGVTGGIAQVLHHEARHVFDMLKGNFFSEQKAIEKENMVSRHINERYGKNFGERIFFGKFSIHKAFVNSGDKGLSFGSHTIGILYTPELYDIAYKDFFEEIQGFSKSFGDRTDELIRSLVHDQIIDWYYAGQYPEHFASEFSP